ncbi:MAG: BirA family transcriptional regulator [Gaiellaceae bacterium]|nr:BirA family transcriptional regulator [Gaiellaceae bacterium]
MDDSLSPEAVSPLLRGRFGRERYVYAEVTASTQRLLRPGDPEGAVATTEEQTEGRGRLGREWLAPRGSSVLCSVLLRPTPPVERWPELSLVAGRAVADAVRAAGVAPTVKHPNDVLVGGRKLSGILAEARDGTVVLGIGVNVLQTADELPAGATSLRLEGATISRPELLAGILERLELAYSDWIREA